MNLRESFEMRAAFMRAPFSFERHPTFHDWYDSTETQTAWMLWRAAAAWGQESMRERAEAACFALLFYTPQDCLDAIRNLDIEQ